MKNYFKLLGQTALVSALVTAGAAYVSAADLPKRTAPPAPVAVPYVPNYPFFVGINGGGTFDRTWSLGAVGGYQWNDYFRSELSYDHNFSQKQYKNTDTVMGNAIVQYPLAYGFTPYALVGAGYQWGDYVSGNGVVVRGNDAMYNLGAGVRYSLTSNIELDARYRYFNSFENNRPANVGTIGVNYRF